VIPQFKSRSEGQLTLSRDISLIPSSSGVSGNYIGSWEEGSLKLQYRVDCFYSTIVIQVNPIVNLDLQISCDSHEFSVAFCFGQSCRLETGKENFMILHDRGVSVIKGECNKYQIGFSGKGSYLLIFLLYSKDFSTDQDLYNPLKYKKGISFEISKFLYNRPIICTREIIEHLTILLFIGAEDATIEFLRNEIIRNIFMEYSNLKICRHYQPVGMSGYMLSHFYNTRDRLLEVAMLPISYPELLLKADISNATHFRKKIKQLYGITTREYITEVRLAHALNLLKDSSLSIKEISWKTGFPSAPYFDRVFVKYFGLAPNNFRKKYLSFP
jgi:AraC-like DNA-binding protein